MYVPNRADDNGLKIRQHKPRLLVCVLFLDKMNIFQMGGLLFKSVMFLFFLLFTGLKGIL